MRQRRRERWDGLIRGIVLVTWLALSGLVGCSSGDGTGGSAPSATPPSATPPSDASAPVLAFPAKDLTLFGRALDLEAAPRMVQWSVASGPAAVRFSAPQALTTTATFTTPGVYVLHLLARDGPATVTRTVRVTVTPASSQTAFYVDPTYTGSTHDGSAATPWKDFTDGNPDYSAQWNTINTALATNDVIIYFSARQASADIPEEIVGSVRVSRTDRSTHRLTLDGMSTYNTNDATPSWADYTGTSKMRIRKTTGCCFSLGWSSPDFGGSKMHYVTMRGFEVTGSGARIVWGGSYAVLEYIWSHDVTTLGATIQFHAAVSDYPTCQDMGQDHDITIRNVLIERGIGEGIYIAGTYVLPRDGGCPSYGNTHADILIEGNTIREPGFHGEEGDGIDLKAGLMHVTVRNNTIANTHRAGEGVIGAAGVFAPARTDYLIEGNRIFNTDVGAPLIGLGLQNGTVIRNNLLYHGGGVGIALSGDRSNPNANIEIYNNTIYGNDSGVSIGDYSQGVTLRNNLVFGNAVGQISAWGSISNIDSDYNLMAPDGATPEINEGRHSIVQTSTAGITVNPVTGDFHLVPGSPAVAAGVDLSALGVTTDVEGNARPHGQPWDIGASQGSRGE